MNPSELGLPEVKPINSSELTPADLEQQRAELRAQGRYERNAYFANLLKELAHARLFMDRVFMRNAIRQIQLCVEEHRKVMKLTAEEEVEWLRLASEALLDTTAKHVPQHCEDMLSFWQTYSTSSGE
jgi:hypothetical protein